MNKIIFINDANMVKKKWFIVIPITYYTLPITHDLLHITYYTLMMMGT